jgi:hypothetical protein
MQKDKEGRTMQKDKEERVMWKPKQKGKPKSNPKPE